MVGYMCAYFRHYYTTEFITSYLNNAASDEDTKNGIELAKKRGIKVTMPKLGASKSGYFFSENRKVIAKGMGSIKHISDSVADELYDMYNTYNHDTFIDVLKAINEHTSVDSRQLDNLIKIDFFSDYGNQRELLMITDLFSNTFNKGTSVMINKDKVDGTAIEQIVKQYSRGVTKAGAESKRYTILDMDAILYGIEDSVKSLSLPDLPEHERIRNFKEIMGYIGYTSGKEEDRTKLYVMEIYPLNRKADGKQFGYSVITKSIGSGVEARFTLFNRDFDKCPIAKGDIIRITGYRKEGQYFTLTSYSKM